MNGIAKDQERPGAAPDLDSPPCACHDWTLSASKTLNHRGHCCFNPPLQTCHGEEVEKWLKTADRVLGHMDRAGTRTATLPAVEGQP